MANNRAFIRFPSIVADNGATVDSCIVKLTASDSDSGTTVNLTLGFADADNQAAPTDASELNALTMTSETVSWSPGAWTDGTQYDSPDLTDSLQEVFDRAGWATGQAVVLIIEDNSSDSSAYRRFSSFDYDSGSEKAELHYSIAD